jgi:hypothetical protein
VLAKRQTQISFLHHSSFIRGTASLTLSVGSAISISSWIITKVPSLIAGGGPNSAIVEPSVIMPLDGLLDAILRVTCYASSRPTPRPIKQLDLTDSCSTCRRTGLYIRTRLKVLIHCRNGFNLGRCVATQRYSWEQGHDRSASNQLDNPLGC